MSGGHDMRAQIFAEEPLWTVADDGRVFYGINSEYNIKVYDADGRLTSMIRREVARIPVTAEHKASILKAMRERMASMGMPAEMTGGLEEMFEFAEFFPAIAGLVAGPEGTLWVQRVRLEADMNLVSPLSGGFASYGADIWDVYDREGNFLGPLTLPARFSPLRWHGEKLLGTQPDSADAPNVVVLRMSRR
jgi:hypothetical protein